jgi:hypothetical protein
MRQVATHADPFTQRLIACGKKSFGGIIKALRREAEGDWQLLSGMLAKLSKETKKLDSFVSGAVDENASTEERSRDIDRALALSKAIAELMALYRDVQGGPQHVREFERGYSPDQLQKCMALEAQVDTRFDKTLMRLMMVQEFRRSQAPKAPQLRQLPALA